MHVVTTNLGFAAALTTEMRAVRRGDDRFAIPRLHTKDWDGDAFARALGIRTTAQRRVGRAGGR